MVRRASHFPETIAQGILLEVLAAKTLYMMAMETELRRTAPIALRAFFIRKAESFYTLSMKKELVKTIFISATN